MDVSALREVNQAADRWVDYCISSFESLIFEVRVAVHNYANGETEALADSMRELGERVENLGWTCLEEAQQMRTARKLRLAAVRAGELGWYIAATYLLSPDWSTVRRAIPWAAWGCPMALEDENAQALIMLLAYRGRMTHEELKQWLSLFALGAEERVIEYCVAFDYIKRDDDGNWCLGANVPKPTRTVEVKS